MSRAADDLVMGFGVAVQSVLKRTISEVGKINMLSWSEVRFLNKIKVF
jgi:hypothetical protein